MAPIARTVYSRALEKPENEALGMTIRRPIGPATMREFMPFLLLDDVEFDHRSSGFGDHPHRGQETMTYILEGSIVHQDSTGGKGILHTGDMQAMRAGRGIIHNETPLFDPVTNTSAGLQLWVALPAVNLNDEPSYTDITGRDCPVASPQEFPGATIKILAGESFGLSAPIVTRAPVWYFDICLKAMSKLSHPIPKEWNALALVLEGKPTIAGNQCSPHEAIFFNRDGEVVELENKTGEARIILIAGDRLDGQEVHRYGPFVDVSAQGIRKTLLDYRTGTNGFEASRGWKGEDIIR